MIASGNNAQRWTRAGAGEPLSGGVKPASVIVHQNQGRITVAHGRVSLSTLHLPGLRASALSFARGLGASTHMHPLSVRRLVHPSLGRAATFIRRCAWRAATQFCFSDHLPCRDTDLLEAHFLERLSSRAGFDDQQHSERLFTRAQEPFAFGATNE